jgi:hypothetical protein
MKSVQRSHNLKRGLFDLWSIRVMGDHPATGDAFDNLEQDLALLRPQCSVMLLSALDLSFIQTQIDKFPMPIPRFTFFRKPVAVRTLLDAIRQVLEERFV